MRFENFFESDAITCADGWRRFAQMIFAETGESGVRVICMRFGCRVANSDQLVCSFAHRGNHDEWRFGAAHADDACHAR